ncbi:DUF3263 domain-containing protein [uncultured Arthrobacter sp.]|uniref:DUF3263 domain-containing protein n=1 Tax=uncultured Arthrobacter sp. TaxID=114050 RepID=UPI0025D22CD8|nr:DUF3263 domain-containing protein [uncultured Arthrobacter sp.]
MLTDTELAILDLERESYRYPAAKETAIVERFGWSAVRYYQALHALIDRAEAEAHDPVTVRRLVRLREARRGVRS